MSKTSIFKLPNDSYTMNLEEHFKMLEKKNRIRFIDPAWSPFYGIKRKGEVLVHRYMFRYLDKDSNEAEMIIDEIEINSIKM